MVFRFQGTETSEADPTEVCPRHGTLNQEFVEDRSESADERGPMGEFELFWSLESTSDIRLLAKFSRHESEDLRRAVAGNPETPGPILCELALDPSPEVRGNVAGNRSCPEDMLPLLLEDPIHGVGYSMARNPQLPLEKFREWVGQDRHVDLSLAQNRACPEDVMLQLIALHPHGDPTLDLATNPSATPRVLEEIVNSDHGSARAAVATHTMLPLPLLLRLLRDPDEQVRIPALSHWNCPIQFLEEAAARMDFEVWAVLAGNPRTPASVLMKLASYKYGPHEYAHSENSPDSQWVETYLEVRESLASNPALPAELLARLGGSEDERVSSRAQSNPAWDGY